MLEEAERLNVDIAPDHKPGYVTLAYTIVNEVGGRGTRSFPEKSHSPASVHVFLFSSRKVISFFPTLIRKKEYLCQRCFLLELTYGQIQSDNSGGRSS